MPNCDIFFDQLQSRQHDALRVKINISNFAAAIQNMRNNIDMQIHEEWQSQQDPQELNLNDNTQSGPRTSKKRRFVEKDDPIPNLKICKEICDTIVVQINELFSFTNYLTIESLFDSEKFKDYRGCFPNEAVKTVCSLFPNVNSLKFKNELSILYTRDDFVQYNGAVPLLQMFFENNLTITFSESVELLTVLCTIPMTTVESERCFSSLKRIK
ncbi:unnamed protein product [Psylliodes chrysocephalus]|uniref:HAT C-terminal dimerisation domain-containing protein n=1 Tax=Psylliodes chrysocephalus TaxID=3402493 RepID=A0A9P0G8L3_9CUCU|nr:unnamed protein product [Psylliodes chrysocephala]